MRDFFKNRFVTILVVIATIILAGVAIFTAIRLYQLRQAGVTPTAPEKPSAAVPAPIQCKELTFNVCVPYADTKVRVSLFRDEERTGFSNLVGYFRDVPFRPNGIPDFDNASSWSAGIPAEGPLPGGGELLAAHALEFNNGTGVRISLVRSTETWFRDVPYINGRPDFTQATAWTKSGEVSEYPGSGTVLAMHAFTFPNNQFARISLVRGTETWYRDVPFRTDGKPDFPRATAWTKAGEVSEYPGTGEVLAMHAFTWPSGKATRISLVRGTETWFRDVPFRSDGKPDFPNASCWQKAGNVSEFPGTGKIAGMHSFVYPWGNWCQAAAPDVIACTTAASPTPTPTATPTHTPTPTPPPGGTTAPTATPTPRPTATPTPIAQASPTQEPSLPVAGTSWPTVIGFGLGILAILGALLLAL